ncbi:hypothetical protein [Saliphagus sp. LR7]|uniref:hypothetical protein n=1 Tax=Saliphagus sp. LR7 TaxID=2282654 RepID=UPI000DF728DC|nr:hypothetical protein [Saliphagus sp. LR7]
MARGTDRHGGASEEPTAEADRIVVSYPADLSEWGRSRLEEPSFLAWLGKTHDAAAAGDVWEEFVDVGCCGSTLDVPLRVEEIEGGSRVGGDTEIEYAVREACGIEGSWQVQSEGAPES